MDSGFSYGDLIVIGAIAVFILLYYRRMIGTTPDNDASRPSPKAASVNEFERVIQLPASRITALTEKKDDFGSYAPSMAETFVSMRGIDKEFTPDEFLNGARSAYEMVIDAYNTSNRDTLKMLLADNIYKQFDSALKDEEQTGNKSKTTLVALSSATIGEANLQGNTATLTVNFLSEQIHLVRDAEGKIIEGDASHQEKVEDSWVFTRNLNSSDLNWKVIET